MRSLDYTETEKWKIDTLRKWGVFRDTFSFILQFCPELALFSSYDLWLWETPEHLHDSTLSSFYFLERFKYIWTADIDTKFCLAWRCSRNFRSYLGDYLSPNGMIHDASVRKFTIFNHLQISIKEGVKTHSNALFTLSYLD